MNTRFVGHQAESFAGKFLIQQGYQIVCQNYRLKFGEIDFIAFDNDCLCFIEVKSRKTWEAPQEAVSRNKQQRMYRVALAYLQEQYQSLDIKSRFDVIAIEEFADNQRKVQLFKNAFDASF